MADYSQILRNTLQMAQVKSNRETSAASDIGDLLSPSDAKLQIGLDRTKETRNNGGKWSWDYDPSNPYNWPARLKAQQVLMIASAAFVTSANLPQL
jgi:hypothetical protein